MTQPLISVVVPVFNEEDNVQPFHDALRAAMEGQPYDWEIVFVNDGSRDRTLDVIRELHAQDARVHALSFSRNFGSHAALAAGLKAARGDAVAVISVDLQDPPALIPQFARAWQEGHDIVWGVRATRDDPPMKKLLARSFYALLRRFVYPDWPVDGMDCGLFSRRVVELYTALPERNSFLFATVFGFGFRQARIPYQRGARARGQSKWPFWKRMKAALDLLISFSYVPVRAMTALGLLVSSVSFLYGALIIYRRVVLGLGGEGWPSTMVAVLFLGGVQLVMLGVLGEYLWRIAEQVNARPRYIVMEMIGPRAGDSPGD